MFNVSLVIATKDRPAAIERLLVALKSFDEGLIVIVVDSSAGQDTREICERTGALYVDGKGSGKTTALNLGVRSTQSELIAFLDDDTVPSKKDWLDHIVIHFSDQRVGYVSGRVVARSDSKPAQKAWELKGALDKGLDVIRLASDFFGKWQLKGVQVQIATMGANHVVRRAVFDKAGLHDERFGPGQLIPGAGADLDLTYRTLMAGFTVVYEPAAVATHAHPETYRDLRWKMFDYGVGDTAVHSKFLIEFRDLRSLFQLGFRLGQNTCRLGLSLIGRYPLPPSACLMSILGNLCGPMYYIFCRALGPPTDGLVRRGTN